MVRISQWRMKGHGVTIANIVRDCRTFLVTVTGDKDITTFETVAMMEKALYTMYIREGVAVTKDTVNLVRDENARTLEAVI